MKYRKPARNRFIGRSRRKRLPRFTLSALVSWSSGLAILAACALGGMTRTTNAADPVDYVQAIDWSRFNGTFGVQPGDTFGRSLVDLLQNESRYELAWVSTQYSVATNAPQFEGVPYYDVYTNFDAYGYEGSIRPLASFAFGTAALLATKTYSSTVAGRVSPAEALHQTELAIRGVAFAHRANKSTTPRFGGRGTSRDKWQAAHWATQAARAAWLVWDQLTPETRAAVANMMVYEADSFTNYTVPYWKTPSGEPSFSIGDTKAEETAWNAQLPALAQAMMPDHPHVEAWRAKASEMQVSAYSRQSDTTSLTLIDGKPTKEWLNGFDMLEDGIVINHSRIHPDYMVSINTRASALVYESLAGQYIPQSTLMNVDTVYRALTKLEFTPGADTLYGTEKTIRKPGGTIYKRTAGGGYDPRIYYPQGNDWTYQVTDSYLNLDLIAEWLGLDEDEDFDAMGWAQARVDAMIALQNRPGHNGNVYQPGDWLKSGRGADEDLYRSNATAWLQWWLMQHDQISPVADRWGAVRVPKPEGLSTLFFLMGVALVVSVWKRQLPRFWTSLRVSRNLVE